MMRLWACLALVVLGTLDVGAVEYFPVCSGTVSGNASLSSYVQCSVQWSWVAAADLTKDDGIGHCRVGSVLGSGRAAWFSNSAGSVDFLCSALSTMTTAATTYAASPTGVFWSCVGTGSSVLSGSVYRARCSMSGSDYASVRSLAVERPDLFELEAGWSMSALGLTSNELLGIIMIGLLVVVYLIGFMIGKQP